MTAQDAVVTMTPLTSVKLVPRFVLMTARIYSRVQCFSLCCPFWVKNTKEHGENHEEAWKLVQLGNKWWLIITFYLYLFLALLSVSSGQYTRPCCSSPHLILCLFATFTVYSAFLPVSSSSVSSSSLLYPHHTLWGKSGWGKSEHQSSGEVHGYVAIWSRVLSRTGEVRLCAWPISFTAVSQHLV